MPTTTSFSNRPRIALGLVLAAVSIPLGSGCALETAEPDAPPNVLTLGVLDQEALEGARLNQREMERSGHVLEGRVWRTANSHVAFYRDAAGRFIHLEVARATSNNLDTAENWRPAHGQDLASYLGEVASYRYLESDDGNGKDIIAFAPNETPGVAVQALTNESCPKTSFDATCAAPTRMYHTDWFDPQTEEDVAVTSWNLTDRSTRDFAYKARGSNGSTVVCADKGTAVLSQTHTDASLNIAPPATIAVSIQEGYWYRYSYAGGWLQQDRCIVPIFGACFDWDVLLRVSHFDVNYGVSTTGNYHSCGYIGSIPGRVISETKGDRAAVWASPM